MNQLEDNTPKVPLKIRIDWAKYFRDFCEIHGKYPVVYQDDWLLFPDGWRYFANSHQGPELAPPVDQKEHANLCLYYWQRRIKIIKNEIIVVKNTLGELDTLQAERSAPLSRVVVYKDDEGKQVVTSERIDHRPYQRRLTWLVTDMAQCAKMIDEYKTKLI